VFDFGLLTTARSPATTTVVRSALECGTWWRSTRWE